MIESSCTYIPQRFHGFQTFVKGLSARFTTTSNENGIVLRSFVEWTKRKD